jgi:hypothetical protein
MNTTVAIVGSHPETRKLAPYDDQSVDIWVFNEAFSQTARDRETNLPDKWCKRADVVFQLHTPAIYRSQYNRSDRNHWQWLQKNHNNLVIYMQEIDDQVPNSEKYPLDELCADLLANIKLVDKHGQKREVRFFTSTIAEALALAIDLNYQRILIYGIEMASATEYFYQREGVAFWIGYAAGRGIEIELHSAHGLFDRPVYAYDGIIGREPEEFQARIDDLEKLHEELYANLKKAEQAVQQAFGNGRLTEHIEQLAQASTDIGKIDGMLEEVKKYHIKAMAMWDDAGTAIIDRNEFEGALAQARDDAAELGKMVYIEEGRMDVIYSSWRQSQDPAMLPILKKAIQAHQAACYNSGKRIGVMEENERLMKQTDELIRAAGGEKALGIVTDSIRR